MDYAKIYDDFIADRLLKQPPSGERHHIVSRSMGGSNKKSNIITMTPEDHFFAHLLLAKAYKTGPLRSAVGVMSYTIDKNCKGKVRRAALAMVRRDYQDYCLNVRIGRAHPCYNPQTFILRNPDGILIEETRFDFIRKYGFTHPTLANLRNGKAMSHKGWTLPETDPTQIGSVARANGVSKAARSHDNQHYRWRHVDGTEITCTIWELSDQTGIGAANLRALMTNEVTIVKGWYLPNKATPKFTIRHDTTRYKLLHKNGTEGSYTRTEMLSLPGLANGTDHLRLLRRGVTVAGWKHVP